MFLSFFSFRKKPGGREKLEVRKSAQRILRLIRGSRQTDNLLPERFELPACLYELLCRFAGMG